MCAADEADIPGSRGTANFVIKWERDSKHAAHLTIISMADIRKKTPKLERDGWTGLIGLECRGLEPTSWSPEVCSVSAWNERGLDSSGVVALKHSCPRRCEPQ